MMLRHRGMTARLPTRLAGAIRTSLPMGLTLAILLSGGGARGPVRTLQAQVTDSSRIARAEISAHPRMADALALITQLRPRFLAGRSEPVVYIDTTRAFSIDDLSTVPAVNVLEIRFLTGADAAARSGKNSVTDVVILVKTRRQATPKNPVPVTRKP